MNISVNGAQQALDAIEKADTEDLMRGLTAVFNHIISMDEGQAIAAWQTLDFVASRFPMGSEKYKIIETFKKAIVNRMANIVRHSGTSWPSKAFRDVTGKTFSRD